MRRTEFEHGSALAGDQEVLARAVKWLRADRPVALATVIRTWGSSPRPIGSLLAMNDDAQFVGSVSGGCIETELVSRYCSGELGQPFPTRIDFGVDRNEANRLGLPCGGRLELMVERLESAEQIERLLEQVEEGKLVARRVCLNTGEVSLHAGDASHELSVSDAAVIKVFGPKWQILLVGDGQLARYLATMARMLEYRVTVCDPRAEFTDPFPLPDVGYSRLMPDDAVRTLAFQPRTAVVTLAHDPKQDDLALTAALETDAFYIGALGSERSARARRQRLTKLGFTANQVARVRGPAGVSIGSKRPSEIALSILAEITATRNGIDAISLTYQRKRA